MPTREQRQAYMREYLKTYVRKALTLEEKMERSRQRQARYAADAVHREAVKAQARAYGKKNPESKRKARLRQEFDLSLAQYESMLAAQGGGCAICGRPPRDDISLHVDHDHDSGAIRGITCFRCNNALGDLNDDPKLLARAAQYLQRHVAANDPEVQEAEALIRHRLKALSAG